MTGNSVHSRADNKNGTGVQHIAQAFTQAGAENRAALIPYLTLGYPSREESLNLVQAAAAGGADLIELGIPFSDPLADGPVIQRATHTALQQGTTVQRCLEMVQFLRAQQITIPLIFMGYYNPMLAYGERAFCRACSQVGVDGLIVPDLPPEEGERLENAARTFGLAQIYLVAPTSPIERIRLVTKHSQGFVYLVSVTGITGPRKQLPADLTAFVDRVRNLTEKPLAVGFGISSPEQARRVATHADGVVVGSALVRLADKPDGSAKVQAFVADLRQAVSCRQDKPAQALRTVPREP